MTQYSLTSLANILSATHIGVDATFDDITIDTRQLKSGECYLAIIGENFDGHNFLADAETKGAVATIISQDMQTTLPYLKVKDTRLALGNIASHRRKQFKNPIVALTGSCGKTTTKQMITSILQTQNPTLCAQGSFNNDVGVPLTLLKLTNEYGYAVVEIGTNYPGEIAYLTEMTKPDVALITNVGPVHLEGFGNVDAVAKEKRSIFSNFNQGGVAILNRDDAYYDFWLSKTNAQIILSFGLHNNADIWADNIKLNEFGQPCFRMHTRTGDIDIQLQLLGEHNVANACAASAVAMALDLDLENIRNGLETMVAVSKRGVTMVGFGGAEVIDDTYNANPMSFFAAIKTLANRPGETVLIMGDMKELGNNAEKYHSDLGTQAKVHGIKKLYAVGELSKAAVDAFGDDGYHFQDKQSLLTQIQPLLHKDMSILVKGSRSAKMEDIVAGLKSIA